MSECADFTRFSCMLVSAEVDRSPHVVGENNARCNRTFWFWSQDKKINFSRLREFEIYPHFPFYVKLVSAMFFCCSSLFFFLARREASKTRRACRRRSWRATIRPPGASPCSTSSNTLTPKVAPSRLSSVLCGYLHITLLAGLEQLTEEAGFAAYMLFYHVIFGRYSPTCLCFQRSQFIFPFFYPVQWRQQ